MNLYLRSLYFNDYNCIIKKIEVEMKSLNIGLLGAMPEEIGGILEKLNSTKEYVFGDLIIYTGFWPSHKEGILINLTLAWSGWGKVSAARAATRMIALSYENKKKLDLLLFTGVAGGIKKCLKQWDIVIPNQVIQHDLDARPIFDKFVIPALKKDKLVPSSLIGDTFEKLLSKKILDHSLSESGKIDRGTIATGDKFISDKESINNLTKEIKDLSAVEMEGAAVAQVAVQEEIPWLIIRTISDNADESAAENFTEFIKKYEKFSNKLISILLNQLSINNEIMKSL